MIKENIQAALNNQLNAELYSSYEYLSISSYFDSVSLTGFAHWLRIQSQEEYAHALKIFDYLLQVDGKVNLASIEAPKVGWKNTQEVFEHIYKHEQNVTESINELVDLAINEKDHATNNFLQWFVSEQVEEEATALKILEKIKLIGDSKDGLFLMDNEMSQRTVAAN